jgi:hypothetical protein
MRKIIANTRNPTAEESHGYGTGDPASITYPTKIAGISKWTEDFPLKERADT